MQRARAIPGPARLAIKDLKPVLQEYYAVGLKPATKNAYKSGQNRFLNFCVKYSINNVLPVTQESFLLCHISGKEGIEAWDSKELFVSHQEHTDLAMGSQQFKPQCQG